MKVLVIGGGGREHALAWRLSKSPSVREVFVAPGNPGSKSIAINVADDPLAFATARSIDLTIVGPEAPLASGVVNKFVERGRPIFGPTREAAQLESSKAFAKQFMERHRIPTARYCVAESADAALQELSAFGFPVVLKADGLAAGKGVIVAADQKEAAEAIQGLFSGQLVGNAGHRVVIEEFLQGEEISFIAVSDGQRAVPLEPSQDHKAIHDGDRGPNTGGMGAYSDSRLLSAAERETILATAIQPVIDGMASAGTPFRGFLYAGVMMTSAGPKVLEYNVRLGDPETQCLLHRMDGDLAVLLQGAASGHADAGVLSFRADPSVCVVMAAAGYPGKVQTGTKITGIDAAESNGSIVFHAGTALNEKGELVCSGGRVLGVTHSGATLRDAIRNAYEAVAKIHFDGMQYRTDIGRRGLSRYNEADRGRSSAG